MSRATAVPTRGPDPAPRALRPVLALADRLRTSLRLVVLVAVLLVPGVFATWSFAGLIGEQVAFAESERAGVRVVRPALTALAATVAGESTDLGDLTAAVRAHPELAADEALEAVTSAASAPEAGTPAGRAATAAAIAALVTRVGDSSKLILDPDLDSFYVMDAQVVQLPKALVAAAQAAAPATGTPRERLAAQAVLAGTISGAGGSLGGDVTTAVANTAQDGLQDRLAPVAAAGEAAQAFAGSLTENLARPGPADPAAVTALTTAASAAVLPLTDTLDALLSTRSAALSARRDVTLAVSVLGLLAAGWFAAAVWWRTRHDVGLTVHGVTAISRGDLEPHPLPGGRDEFGNIGRALVEARDQLRAQTAALREAQAERELQVEHGLEQQRVASEHVRSRAQSVIDETATLVAGELAEVVGQVGDVRQTAGTIEERVGAADAATRSVVDQASRATQVVADLGASLQRVASMAQLIGGVADQTKLLALNATIEAARAGEAGRGFSVVADEVKNLAMTTARSTDEITATIGSLEREAQAMAFAITSMTEAIGEVDQATGVLGDVAARQHSLVDRLDTCVNDALNRVQDMSRLTERL